MSGWSDEAYVGPILLDYKKGISRELDRFDPNDAKAPETPTWATFIPDRRGKKFKVYTNRGHALNSFTYRDTGILYEWIDGRWVERFRLDGFRLADSCDDCGEDLVKTSAVGSTFRYNVGYRKWVEMPNGALRLGTFCLRDAQRRNRLGKRGMLG